MEDQEVLRNGWVHLLEVDHRFEIGMTNGDGLMRLFAFDLIGCGLKEWHQDIFRNPALLQHDFRFVHHNPGGDCGGINGEDRIQDAFDKLLGMLQAFGMTEQGGPIFKLRRLGPQGLRPSEWPLPRLIHHEFRQMQ